MREKLKETRMTPSGSDLVCSLSFTTVVSSDHELSGHSCAVGFAPTGCLGLFKFSRIEWSTAPQKPTARSTCRSRPAGTSGQQKV